MPQAARTPSLTIRKVRRTLLLFFVVPLIIALLWIMSARPTIFGAELRSAPADTVRLCFANPDRKDEWKPPKDTFDYFIVSRLPKRDTIIAVPKSQRWMPIIDESYIFTYVNSILVRIKLLHNQPCEPLFHAASKP